MFLRILRRRRRRMIYERRRLIPVAYRTVRCFREHYARAGCFSRETVSEALPPPQIADNRRFLSLRDVGREVRRVILLTDGDKPSRFSKLE